MQLGQKQVEVGVADPEVIRQVQATMERNRVSKHEAAHAVTAQAMGARVDSVTLEDGGVTVVAWPAQRSVSRTDWRALGEKRVAYCLSGQIVDDPGWDEGSADDAWWLQHLALQVYGVAVGFLEADDDHDVHGAGREVRELLPSDPLTALKYIEAIATKTRDLIRQHWNSIEAVASQLLKRDTLSGDEVRAIITQAQHGHPAPKP